MWCLTKAIISSSSVTQIQNILPYFLKKCEADCDQPVDYERLFGEETCSL